MKEKPVKLFIASSSEAVRIANAVQSNLDGESIHTTVWTQSIFKNFCPPIASLLREAKNFDYAVFVLTPDDKIFTREKIMESPRDNLIFELGLFTGLLGLPCCFAITPKDTSTLKLPTDLSGLVMGHYDPLRKDLVAALGAACFQISEQIHDDKSHPRSFKEDTSADKEIEEDLSTEIKTLYGSFTVEQLEMTIGFIWQEYSLDLTQLLAPETGDFYTQTHSHTNKGYFNYLKKKQIKAFSFKYFDKGNRTRKLICDIDQEEERIEITFHMAKGDVKKILDRLIEELGLSFKDKEI